MLRVKQTNKEIKMTVAQKQMIAEIVVDNALFASVEAEDLSIAKKVLGDAFEALTYSVKVLAKSLPDHKFGNVYAFVERHI
jgi:hypothetical protein